MPAKRVRKYVEQTASLSTKNFKKLLERGDGVYKLNKSITVKAKSDKLNVIINEVDNHIQYRLIKTGFGSGRLLFDCPTCSKHYASLFIVKSKLGCRKCFGLEYVSNSNSKYLKAQHAIIKKRLKLWGTEHKVHGSDIYNMFENSCNWVKPKGIRNATWEKEREELKHLESIYLEYIILTCGAAL